MTERQIFGLGVVITCTLVILVIAAMSFARLWRDAGSFRNALDAYAKAIREGTRD